MKKATLFINQYTILVFTLLVSVNLFSQIIVDNNIGVNAPYSDLQLAIDQATANDVIYVHPSETSYGNIILDKPLTIIGKSHSQVGVEITKIYRISFTPASSGSIIRGFNISENVNFNGINGTSFTSNGEQVENITIEYCKVNNTLVSNTVRLYNFDNSWENIPSSNNITIRGNIISRIVMNTTNLFITNNWIWARVTIWRPDSTVINHNIFTGSNIINNGISIAKVLVQNCMFLKNTSANTILHTNESQYDNCLTYNYGSGIYNISATATNMLTNTMLLNTNPLFENLSNGNLTAFYIDNDYSLQVSSPAVGTGFNGEDIGIFGNGYVFNNTGTPAEYPSVTITNSTAVVPNNGTLSVTITAKAN